MKHRECGLELRIYGKLATQELISAVKEACFACDIGGNVWKIVATHEALRKSQSLYGGAA